MKKILFLIFVVCLFILAACGKTETKPIPAKTPTPEPVTPVAAGANDQAVSSVGNAIADVDTTDQELNQDDTKDIDSGLDDIDSI